MYTTDFQMLVITRASPLYLADSTADGEQSGRGSGLYRRLEHVRQVQFPLSTEADKARSMLQSQVSYMPYESS